MLFQQTEVEPKEKIEVTFRSTEEEEHLKEVFVKRDVEPVQQEVEIGTSLKEAAADEGNQELAEEEEAKDEGSQDEKESVITEDGYVVYAKHGEADADVAEVEKEKTKVC